MAAFVPVIVIMYYCYRVNHQRIEALRKSQNFLDSTLNSLTTSVAILDEAGSILAVNQAWKAKRGSVLFGAEHQVGMNYLATCQSVSGNWSNAARALIEAVQRTIEGRGEETSFEYSANDDRIQDSFSVKVTRFDEGGDHRVVVAHEDITELRKAERKVIRMAYYDKLTGLPNRSFITEHLKLLPTRSEMKGKTATLLAVSLDHLDHVNTTFGFSAGETVLAETATRLLRLFGQTNSASASYTPKEDLRITASLDKVARIGGDDFLVVLTDVEATVDAVVEAKRIQEQLSAPFILGGQEVFITASIGITSFFEPSTDAETLMQQADTAVHHAKKRGKNHFQFYTETLSTESAERISIEARLRRALERQNFTLLYQPRVLSQNGQIHGAEALVRLTDLKSEMTPPSQFIPIAEETGLIIPITEWILLEACRQTKEWQERSNQKITVSVNISARHLQEGGLVECVKEALDRTGLDPSLLELEITEGILLEDFEGSNQTLSRLRQLGIGIALDDFGTGYSSLSYLSRLPITSVKIDRSFLNDLWKNRAIVKAIVSAAAGLNLRTVAEGVETEDQLAFVHNIGCKEVQGYYFSPPLSPTALSKDWLEDSPTANFG
jgi:diguanylate cyclase (GGDEF)-like protein